MATVVSIIQGESIDWNFDLTDDVGGVVDITGYTVKIGAASTATDAMLFEFSAIEGQDNGDSPITVTDAAQGLINTLILDTTSYGAGNYNVEVAFISPAGKVTKPSQFKLVILKGILL